jgi:hypothetical protein
MDVLAIILACSLHPDDALVRTLVDVQSSGNVYFVGDLATLETNDSLKSADTALRFAQELQRRGGRPAVGLLGVPLSWAARYGRAPAELFDACTNVAIATAAFAEYGDRCSGRLVTGHGRQRHSRRPRGDSSRASLRLCLLSRFARDLGVSSKPAAILQRLVPVAPPPNAGPVDESARVSPVFEGSATEESQRPGRDTTPSLLLESRAGLAPR